jgi:hypothetical protein
MDIFPMIGIVMSISNSMINIATLPNFPFKAKFSSGAERKPTFDELDSTFERHFPAQRYEQMDVVRHYGKFVYLEFPLCSISTKRFEEKHRHPFGLKNGFALRATDREEIDLVRGRIEIPWWFAHVILRG